MDGCDFRFGFFDAITYSESTIIFPIPISVTSSTLVLLLPHESIDSMIAECVNDC